MNECITMCLLFYEFKVPCFICCIIAGTVIAGRYEVSDVLGQAAFSTALQCAGIVVMTISSVLATDTIFVQRTHSQIWWLKRVNRNGCV